MSAAAGIGAISISTIEGGYRGKTSESQKTKAVIRTCVLVLEFIEPRRSLAYEPHQLGSASTSF